ncbi:MAG: hypothetical protein ABIA04_14085 [Pseudomonadota bacterium]
MNIKNLLNKISIVMLFSLNILASIEHVSFENKDQYIADIKVAIHSNVMTCNYKWFAHKLDSIEQIASKHDLDKVELVNKIMGEIGQKEEISKTNGQIWFELAYYKAQLGPEKAECYNIAMLLEEILISQNAENSEYIKEYIEKSEKEKIGCKSMHYEISDNGVEFMCEGPFHHFMKVRSNDGNEKYISSIYYKSFD